LEAAGSVFADQGFHNATVREICRKAGVNVAAVNYHFRDKEHLYETVLQYAHRYALESHPPDGTLGPDATPEERLNEFVRAFLRRLTDEGRPAWHGLLMIREITTPTAALDTLVEGSVRPLYAYLCSIVASLLDRTPDDRQVRLCTSSVVGQCMHFRVSREILLRLNPDITYSPENVEAIARHIVRFSLAAIGCLREDLEGRS
jgi:AcrR family transcriptional regulator